MGILGHHRKAGGAPTFPSHCSIVSWEVGGIRASVVEIAQGAAELMGVAAVPVHGISRTSHPDVDRWLSGCDKALTQAEDMTVQSCGRKIVPDQVVMSVPTEITRDVPVLVSRQRPDGRSGITMDEVGALLQRGYRRAQDAIQSQVASSRDRRDDLICASVSEMTIDGQVVMDPLRMHGDRLDLSLSFFLAPVEWIRACELVAERLELNLMGLIPQHVTFASSLTDDAALLILLDEHHTVLSLVRHGRLIACRLVESGEREITSATVEALGLRGRQADALMRAYRARQLREDAEAQLAHSFWVPLRVWMTTMGQALQDMITAGTGQPGELPHKIYFADLTRRIPEALPSLETPFWEQCGPFGRCPEVTLLAINTISDVLDCTTQAGGPGYLPLRALAHYVAQLETSDNALEQRLLAMLR
jgi:hypothetical protein